MAKLGLKEAVSMALGGMIGGGIYSAFGIVVSISGRTSWLAFLLAGTIAMCAGYSYVKVNGTTDPEVGGAPTFLSEIIGNDLLTGLTGWTLLFGYIVSIALYAFAFSSFLTKLVGREAFLQIPLANFISIFLIMAFVGLNLMGASETGKAEVFLVVIKVGVIGVFGIWGVVYTLQGGFFKWGAYEFFANPTMGATSPFLGAAMSMVTFQGWQLLMYDQDKFENPHETIPKAIYIAIPTTTVLYILVAFTTTSILQPPVIAVSPETSLLYAALPFIGQLGAFIIGISALFSTASAVNATLFSGALFSRQLITIGVLPDLTGVTEGDQQEIPPGIVIVLGVLASLFAVYGSLTSITSFASLAFIAVFGGISYVAFAERDDLDIIAPIPVVGVIGCLVYFPLLLYDLYIDNPSTFWLVIIISLLVISSELLYFERDSIAEKIRRA